MAAVLNRRLLPLISKFVKQWPVLSAEMSSAQAESQNVELQCSRTSESNPANHTADQSGMFYTVPKNDAHIFQYGGFPKPFASQCTTFNETCLMIRKQGVEIIQYMLEANYDNVPLKYVLYGKPGTGKSIIMTHVLHHCYTSKFLLVHVPWVGNWLRSPKRQVNSPTRPGLVDLPENAVKWLLHFKTQNYALIKELDLRLANDYEWSIREHSKAGDPLSDVVELGLNRSRHACEVIIALLKEIKSHSKLGKCKTVVAIDGYNSFFHEGTRVRNEDKVFVSPDKISIIPSFIDMVKPDWHNGAVIVTCDEMSVPGHDKSHLPLYQLGIKGYHNLEPFIPVFVPSMTDGEIRSILAYYKERRWLHTPNGDDELAFLCGGNPYNLMQLCRGL